MSLFAKHRWWVLLLGLSLFAWSFMSASQQLEYALYSRMASLVPVLPVADKTVVVTLREEGGHAQAGSDFSHKSVSYQQLADVLRHLKNAQVAAVGLALPLDTLQTRVDAPTMAHLRERLNLPEDKRILQQLDPDARLRDVLQYLPAAVLASPFDPALMSSLSVTAANDNIPLLYSFLSPPLLHGVSTEKSLISSPVEAFSQLLNTALFTENHHRLRAASPLAIPVFQQGREQFLPSFELMLAAHSLGVTEKNIRVLPGRGVSLGESWYPTDAGLRVYPRVRDSSWPIHVLSAQYVLTDPAADKHLRGKTVVLGLANGPLAQLVDVPGGFQRTALEWSAQVVNAIITDSFIDVPYWSFALQRGALLLITIYLLLLPARLRGNLGLAISVALAFVMLNGNVLLMVLDNSWLPVALPVLLLLSGQSLLWLHQWLSRHNAGLRAERDTALVDLSNNLRTQGQLDQAYERLTSCVPSVLLQEALYQLGLDFERRRQFSKALAAYDAIAEHNHKFRDIRERRARHRQIPETLLNTRAPSGAAYAATKLVMDDPKVEKPVLGRYEIERELGRGAMGTVYLGHDPRIGRTVAIKTLALTEEFESEQLAEVRWRFFQEAETAGRLNHPNIVTVFDVGEEHDLAYIAMDYITGSSLDKHVHTDALLPVAQVFEIGAKVADALHYAHQQKVVHRDVKPGNIIFDADNSQLKVTDFGIACLTDNSKTRTGTVLGSPFYMSPEQIAGQKVDGRSDLFSLGVTLYQLLTGHLPFEGDSLTSLIYQITNEKPVAIRKLRPELPTCVTRLINKALEKSIDKRYVDGKIMAEAIRRCAEQFKTG
jgi:eukaryotic-like serine/threonine-protein kinase